jgi:hypothetical protein
MLWPSPDMLYKQARTSNQTIITEQKNNTLAKVTTEIKATKCRRKIK